MLAAFAIERSRSTNNLGYIALAGMAAGYFVGGKYLGLIFAATCGLVILFQSDGIKRAALFAFFALFGMVSHVLASSFIRFAIFG